MKIGEKNNKTSQKGFEKTPAPRNRIERMKSSKQAKNKSNDKTQFDVFVVCSYQRSNYKIPKFFAQWEGGKIMIESSLPWNELRNIVERIGRLQISAGCAGPEKRLPMQGRHITIAPGGIAGRGTLRCC